MTMKKMKNYNDGIVYIYKEKTKQNKFNAKENCDTMDDLDFIIRLNFEEMSRRHEDIIFAESLGSSLSMKIRTPLKEKMKANDKAIINNFLYNISHVDPDRKNNELYLYLEGVKEIARENK